MGNLSTKTYHGPMVQSATLGAGANGALSAVPQVPAELDGLDESIATLTGQVKELQARLSGCLRNEDDDEGEAMKATGPGRVQLAQRIADATAQVSHLGHRVADILDRLEL